MFLLKKNWIFGPIFFRILFHLSPPKFFRDTASHRLIDVRKYFLFHFFPVLYTFRHRKVFGFFRDTPLHAVLPTLFFCDWDSHGLNEVTKFTLSKFSSLREKVWRQNYHKVENFSRTARASPCEYFWALRATVTWPFSAFSIKFLNDLWSECAVLVGIQLLSACSFFRWILYVCFSLWKVIFFEKQKVISLAFIFFLWLDWVHPSLLGLLYVK